MFTNLMLIKKYIVYFYLNPISFSPLDLFWCPFLGRWWQALVDFLQGGSICLTSKISFLRLDPAEILRPFFRVELSRTCVLCRTRMGVVIDQHWIFERGETYPISGHKKNRNLCGSISVWTLDAKLALENRMIPLYFSCFAAPSSSWYCFSL